MRVMGSQFISTSLPGAVFWVVLVSGMTVDMLFFLRL